jgi:hypothetical protein
MTAHTTACQPVLEGDDRFDAVDEILDDVARIRARIAGQNFERTPGYAFVGPTG